MPGISAQAGSTGPFVCETALSACYGRPRDHKHGPGGAVEDGTGHRAEKRAGDGPEAARADDNHYGVTGMGEAHDLLGGVALQDLLVRLDCLLVDEAMCAVECAARVRHLLAQLLLVVGVPKRPEGRPHVDENRPCAERSRKRCAGADRPIGRLRPVRRDDDVPPAHGRCFHGQIVLGSTLCSEIAPLERNGGKASRDEREQE
jgi:hypothetical protein